MICLTDRDQTYLAVLRRLFMSFASVSIGYVFMTGYPIPRPRLTAKLNHVWEVETTKHFSVMQHSSLGSR